MSGRIAGPARNRCSSSMVGSRPRFAESPFTLLANSEVVVRYSFARFSGIDMTMLDPTTFATPLDAPVNRNQYAIGYNYYFTPGLVLRFAYEFNQELGQNLHDDTFMAQLVWAF